MLRTNPRCHALRVLRTEPRCHALRVLPVNKALHVHLSWSNARASSTTPSGFHHPLYLSFRAVDQNVAPTAMDRRYALGMNNSNPGLQHKAMF